MRTLLLILTICSTSVYAAGPIERWAHRGEAFRQTLSTSNHDSYCDWVRFSLLTWSAYLAAGRQGEVYGWTNGQVNACRHAIWQYQLARAFDESTAEALGDMQEQFSSNQFDTIADQQNNEAARTMYRIHRAQHVPLGEALQAIVESVNQQNGLFQTHLPEPNAP